MAKEDPWPVIRGEREALANDLEGLTDEQWDTASLCEGWTVRDVLAHMTGTAKISGGSFFPKLIGAGFSLTKLQAKDIAAERGASPADTLDNFKSIVTSTKHPPGPIDTWLGETIVHSEDIRRALGVQHQYPVAAATRVADFYKGSNLVLGAKKRITGVKLAATDTDWSNGEGPEASGPIVALVMVMSGRHAALGDLTGDGVEVLRSRT